MELPSYATSRKLALAGGVLAILGVALPWASIGGVTFPGYYGDGFIAFMAGVSVVGIVLVRPWTRLSWVGVGAFAVMVLLLAGNALLTLLGPNTGVGPGLLVQLGGGALALVGASYATQEGPADEGATDTDDVGWDDDVVESDLGGADHE